MKIDKILFFGAGLIVGMLIAPKKGSETIVDIKDNFIDKSDYLRGKISEFKSSYDDTLDDIEESFYTEAANFKNEFVELKEDLEEKTED